MVTFQYLSSWMWAVYSVWCVLLGPRTDRSEEPRQHMLHELYAAMSQQHGSTHHLLPHRQLPAWRQQVSSAYSVPPHCSCALVVRKSEHSKTFYSPNSISEKCYETLLENWARLEEWRRMTGVWTFFLTWLHVQSLMASVRIIVCFSVQSSNSVLQFFFAGLFMLIK